MEGPSKKNADVVTARTRGNRPVHIAGWYPAGTFMMVQIERAAPHHLHAGAV